MVISTVTTAPTITTAIHTAGFCRRRRAIRGGTKMRWSTTTAFAAILLAGATGVSIAQTANQPAAGPSFEDLVGKKLTAIDGSSIALTAAEGGMAREIVAANGTIQRSYFAFLNEKLGTVADANDIRKVTGVFRRSDTAMDIQYSVGSTE